MSLLERIHRYDADNEQAARRILAEPHRFGGENALPVRWARLWWSTHRAAVNRRKEINDANS